MASVTPTKRRDTRYEIRFPAQVRDGRRTYSFFTEDVSFRGVFLRTDAPPPMRRLVHLRLVLPPGDTALEAHGMVVHFVEYGNAFERVPGIGVQLYGLDRDTRSVWESFVREAAACCPLSPSPPLVESSGKAPNRRSRVRQTAVLRVAVDTTEALHELYVTNVSKGGLFVATELELIEGTAVVVHVAHPDTEETFLLDAVVRHRKIGGRGVPRGVGVELVGMDAARRQQFLDFVRGGIVIGDVEDQSG